MFTRCPQCHTRFAVTEQQLSLGDGDVRCGNCAMIFNATEWLVDSVATDTSEEKSDHPSAGVRDADDIGDVVPGAGDMAGSMEFDAPEDHWDEFFIDGPGAGTQRGDVPLDGELEAITADPEEWSALLGEVADSGPWEQPHTQSDADHASRIDQRGEPEQENSPEHFSDTNDWSEAVEEALVTGYDDTKRKSADEPAPPAEIRPGLDYDEWLPTRANAGATTDSGDAQWAPEGIADATAELDALDVRPWEGPENGKQRVKLWLSAACIAAITLTGQLVHINRDDLATSQRAGETLRAIYTRLGQPLLPNWPIEAYTVRRAEALAGGSAPDALDIAAAVDIVGDGPVGLPMVRVSIRDQWANTIASRVFSPDEYLGTELPTIVPAGTRIPVRVSVLDPGVQARGYLVDVCLPRRSRGLECQNDRELFAGGP